MWIAMTRIFDYFFTVFTHVPQLQTVFYLLFRFYKSSEWIQNREPDDRLWTRWTVATLVQESMSLTSDGLEWVKTPKEQCVNLNIFYNKMMRNCWKRNIFQ